MHFYRSGLGQKNIAEHERLHIWNVYVDDIVVLSNESVDFYMDCARFLCSNEKVEAGSLLERDRTF